MIGSGSNLHHGANGSGSHHGSAHLEANPSLREPPGSGTEIMPVKVKGPHTRIRPLGLAIHVATPERALLSTGEWPLHGFQKCVTASIPKRPCNGRFMFHFAFRF
jgi:hypothetical protein